MKNMILSLLPLSLISINNAQSEELTAEISSGQYCQSKLYKQFKKTEQTNHERLKFKPTDKLMQFVTSMELMCPWESQRDYNGDKKDDWIAFVQLGSEYQLVSYMSDRQSYQLKVISSSSKLPANSFIRWLPSAQLKNFTKQSIPINNLSYALQVSDFDGMTEFYLWDGKEMRSVLKTPQMF
jgi:hypothetical protein